MVAIDVAANLARAHGVATVAGTAIVVANDGALVDDGALCRSFGGDPDGGKAGQCDETGGGEGE
jgi:hypothetical protein